MQQGSFRGFYQRLNVFAKLKAYSFHYLVNETKRVKSSGDVAFQLTPVDANYVTA